MTGEFFSTFEILDSKVLNINIHYLIHYQHITIWHISNPLFHQIQNSSRCSNNNMNWIKEKSNHQIQLFPNFLKNDLLGSCYLPVWYNLIISSLRLVPPRVTITLVPRWTLRSLHICEVWRANSLVGTSTKAEWKLINYETDTFKNRFVTVLFNSKAYQSFV